MICISPSCPPYCSLGWACCVSAWRRRGRRDWEGDAQGEREWIIWLPHNELSPGLGGEPWGTWEPPVTSSGGPRTVEKRTSINMNSEGCMRKNELACLINCDKMGLSFGAERWKIRSSRWESDRALDQGGCGVRWGQDNPLVTETLPPWLHHWLMNNVTIFLEKRYHGACCCVLQHRYCEDRIADQQLLKKKKI
jgi:hypothetical protein